MAEMSNYLKAAYANYFFRPSVAAPTRPTSNLISLWSAITDSDAGTGTELNVGTSPGYARSAVTWGAASIPGGVMTNNFACVFPTATANWVTATHYGVHDHLGNLLQSLTAVASPIAVLAGNHYEAASGTLILTFS